ERLLSCLKAAKISYSVESTCPANPDVDFISHLAKKLNRGRYDVLIALGGGSVIDAAKGIALLAANDPFTQNIWDLNTRQNCSDAFCKLIAVPTTVGTGSEGNGTFILYNKAIHKKRDYFHLSIRPSLAWLDPTNVVSLPITMVENGLIDAISHLLEQYFRDDEEDVWSDFSIVGLLEYGVECFDQRMLWERSDHLRANIQMLSLIAMSYLFSQGKRLSWSLHNELDALTDMDKSHAYLIRKHMPEWFERKIREEKNAKRSRRIQFLVPFMEAIKQT
ncbi:MAG: iron-containing alcohol dehydrogenase, partial [Myxococcota bacterium]|nr:iron-containing alcohol dehydrogenase [Myxococcota bacterium]